MEVKGLARGWLLVVILAALFCAAPISSQAADEAGRIQLDADSISFEESNGIATAEGNVRISNGEIRLFAPYVEYDSDGQQVRAFSSPEGSVTFVSGGNRLSGERLDYNVATRSGVLTRPYGKVESFYVRGESIEVMPARDGKSAGSDTSRDGELEELEAHWSRASLTTCGAQHPHYRLEAREVTVIPGKRVVIRKPSVYLGDTMLFSYPFDYVVRLDEHAKRGRQSLFPRVGYESDKGVGLGFSGGWGWETGTLDVGAIGWSEEIWEGEAFLTQDIWNGMSVYGGLRREYDKDRDSTEWRPSWGLELERGGWHVEAGWRQKELLTVEKQAGLDHRYILWRKPEVNILSPWFNDPAAGGYYRLMATWGRYEDATFGAAPTVERTGAGIQTYGEFASPNENFQPFYNALYWHYKYDGASGDEQRLLDAVIGARWKLGVFEMESAYLRRWSWGSSPMAWDDYDDREEIYHEVGYRIPTKKPDTSWKIGVRGAYSIIDEELAEMIYKVDYDMHCMLWEAVYRDDRRGDDDWFGLKLIIKAYPESGVRLSGNDVFDPAKAPDGLVPDL
ncbi:MAG: hypothetical protein LBT08_00165 [Synergistaceae bacterium]|nr:hypothetical protein [Synergistaceae bacterium]